jgi:hypothetical protein
MKTRAPEDSGTPYKDDEKMTELKEGAVQFAERQPYELVMWPADLRRELLRATSAN